MLRKILILAISTAFVFAACRKREDTHLVSRTKVPAEQQTPAQSASATPPVTASGATGVGSAMPAYSAPTLDGKTFDLASERGNVVLLNLWATWCGPCRFEIPELQKMHEQYGAQGFKVVGVSLDDSGPDTVRQFVTEHKMTYPVLLDPEGKLANLFQTSVIPTTVLIDRNGKIVWKEFGAIETGDRALKKALDDALAEKRG